MYKKIRAKTISILLTLAMVLSLMPALTLTVSAIAVDLSQFPQINNMVATSDSSNNGDMVLTVYKRSDGNGPYADYNSERGNLYIGDAEDNFGAEYATFEKSDSSLFAVNFITIKPDISAATIEIYGLDTNGNVIGNGFTTSIAAGSTETINLAADGDFSSIRKLKIVVPGTGYFISALDVSTAVSYNPPTLIATGGTPTFTENGSAVALFSGVTAATNDFGQTFNGMTLTVSNVADSTEHLYINGIDVKLLAGESGNLSVGNYTVAVFSNTATVTVSGMSRSDAQMGTLIEGITYRNNSDNPSTTNRTIKITGITDSGLSNNSSFANITSIVSVASVNDAPTIKTNAGITVNEASADNIITKGELESTDVDTAASSIVYTLSAAPSKGTLKNNGSALAMDGTFTQFDINNSKITYTHDGSETTADSFQFTVSDGTDNISETTFAITVTSVNDAPTVNSVNPATISYTDTATNDTFTNTIGTISASDSDGSIAYHDIFGSSGGSYIYDGITYNEYKAGTYGTLYVKSLTGEYLFVPNSTAINAVSADQSETFTVTAVDNEGATGSATLTVSITGANDTPTGISLSSNSVNQSGGANSTVGTLSTTDADSGQTFSYSLVTGDGNNDKDNALFDISGYSLLVKNPGAMAAGTYNVYFRTTDSGNAALDKAFTVTVTDNVTPTVTSVSVPTNGTYKAGQSLNFTVNFSESVTVNTGSGTPSITLTIDGKPVYATYQSGSSSTALVFQYTVQSGDDSKGSGIGMSVAALANNGGTTQDAAGNDADLTLSSVGSMTNVKVDAVAPAAPTIQSLSAASDTGILTNDKVTQNTTPTFTGRAEGGSTVTLYDTNGTTVLGSSTADGSGNWSLTSAALSQGSHTITAKAADAAGNTSSVSSGFAVVIDTIAPSITNSATMTVSTTSATDGATVCALTASDATNISGFTETLTWSISGGTDLDKFLVSDTSLLISNSGGLSVGSYTVQVTATDTAGNTSAKAITVTVVSGPTVSSASHAYTDSASNDAFSNATGNISAVANSGSITAYGINGGTTGGSTAIDGITYDVSKAGTYGTLYVKSSDGSYVYVPASDAVLNALTATATDSFVIEATDAAGTEENTLTVTINGVNDTPTLGVPFAGIYTDTAADDTFSNTTGTLVGADRDSSDTLVYGITGGTDGGSEVYRDGTYGTLYVTKSTGVYRFVPEDGYIEACITNAQETFPVTVSDGTLTGTQTFTVSITGAYDTPTISSGDPSSFAENGTGTVYQASSSDRDAEDSITWSLGGPDKALFNISNDGTVTFNDAPDYENKKDTGTENVYHITVIATDQGGLTGSKDIAITVTNVNEAPIITTDSAISVVEGSTAAFTATATDPEKDSLKWSIKDGEDRSAFLIDAGKGAVTFKTTPSFSSPTDTNKDNKYELDIAVTDGKANTVKSVVVTVTQKATGGGNATSNSKVVEVNGEKQDAGNSSTVTTSSGQIQETIKIDDTKLDKILDNSSKKPTVTLPATKGSDVVVGELNGQTVKNMEQKEAVLQIKTENVTYTLPASQINIDSVSSQIGTQVELKDIKVSVKIAEPTAETVKLVENTANKGNYLLVVKPVEFDITCTSGNKTVEVSKFNGYVERTVVIPDGVDPKKITTGIVLNEDGSFSHVPTKITVINGKYYAKINSLTDSTYSVIYNPVTFADVANHWAKDAVNDMGSRMVVAGMGDDTYQPDRSITRAEFSTIVVRAMGLKKGTTESSFGDVTLTDWFNGYVDTATDYSLIAGYDSTSYGPNDTITREQAMAILARAMKFTGLSVNLTDNETSTLLAKYTDGASVSSYAKTSAAICLKTGIITGSSATTLSPKASVTRAEVAVMVQRLLQKSGLI